MVLGWIQPSTPARGERVLGPSMAGTACFSNASIRGGCTCALYFFAFLPQSLTVNWENIIPPTPLLLLPYGRSLCPPASTSWEAPAPAQGRAVPTICPPHAQRDYALSAGTGGSRLALAAGEWWVYFPCVFRLLYQGCPKTTLLPCTMYVQEGENVVDPQMNLEGLCLSPCC